jgi:hypothetical protein
MPILTPQESVESLAAQIPPEITLSPEEQDRIAHLALALTQEAKRRRDALRIDVDDRGMVPYRERDAQQRANMRAGVIRVVQALQMLGYLER